MPWHKKPMKDVEACEKPRGGGKQPLIRGCPNGKTYASKRRMLYGLSPIKTGTMRTETSQ